MHSTGHRWASVGLVLILGLFGITPVGLAQTATTTPGTSATSTTVATDTPTAPSAATGTPAATPQVAPATPIVTVDPNAVATPVSGDNGGGGPRNLVKVQNLQDNSLRVDGNVQLGRIPGPMVAPVNLAQSYSSCVSCQTLSVALQVDLTSKDSVRSTPQNAAIAVNYACTNCRTIAIALQYVLPVDDPTQVPPEVNQLIAEMRHQLVLMRGDDNLPDAEARALSVVSQFQDLAANLNQQQDESTQPTTPDAPPPAS